MLKGYYTENIEKKIYVNAGEVTIASADELLISSPLGSCIAVIAYDSVTFTGGIAHVMLPGTYLNGKNKGSRYRYAEDAINHLLNQLEKAGADLQNLKFCLVGGANVLKLSRSTIEKEIIKSVHQILSDKKVAIIASSLGGVDRRTAKLDIESGKVYYTLGDSSELVLCSFND